MSSVWMNSRSARPVPQSSTAGAPVAIKLVPHTSPRGFVQDGADIALVDVEVVDAKGRRVPVDNSMIHFTLDGPAQWLGGIAQGDSSGRPRRAEPVPGHDPRWPGTARDEDNMILSKNLPVENGVNRVLLRAGASAGAVRLRAAGEGLKDATITIPAVAPPKVTGGLSSDFAENHQPGTLTRGPTPAAPTITTATMPSDPASIVITTRSLRDSSRSRRAATRGFTGHSAPGT